MKWCRKAKRTNRRWAGGRGHGGGAVDDPPTSATASSPLSLLCRRKKSSTLLTPTEPSPTLARAQSSLASTTSPSWTSTPRSLWHPPSPMSSLGLFRMSHPSSSPMEVIVWSVAFFPLSARKASRTASIAACSAKPQRPALPYDQHSRVRLLCSQLELQVPTA
jgi:hypothetical protein